MTENYKRKLATLIAAVPEMECLVDYRLSSLNITISWRFGGLRHGSDKTLCLCVNRDTDKIIEALHNSLMKTIAGLDEHIRYCEARDAEQEKIEAEAENQKREQILQLARQMAEI